MIKYDGQAIWYLKERFTMEDRILLILDGGEYVSSERSMAWGTIGRYLGCSDDEIDVLDKTLYKMVLNLGYLHGHHEPVVDIRTGRTWGAVPVYWISDSGRIFLQQRLIMLYVETHKKNPPTPEEISRGLGIGEVSVTDRLTELIIEGKITPAGPNTVRIPA